MNRFFTTSLLLCLSWVCLCTALIHPADNFSPSEDALTLTRALKRPQNLSMITNVLTRRSAEQRLRIANILVRKGKLAPITVRELLECRLRAQPEYKKLVLALLTPMHELYFNEMLLDNIPGTGSTDAFLEVFNIWPYAELKKIYEEYLRKHQHLLNNRGLRRRIVDGALSGKRNESQEIDVAAAQEDAKFINTVSFSPTLPGTRSQKINLIEDIFITRSHRQLRRIFEEYKKLYGNDIDNIIHGHQWSTDVVESLSNMINGIRSATNYYATWLYHSFTPNTIRVLTRIIVSRSEIDLDEIKEQIFKNKNVQLTSRIEYLTSGEFQRALLAIVNS